MPGANQHVGLGRFPLDSDCGCHDFVRSCAHARDIVYADNMDISKPKQLESIGIGCAACERMDCTQRAHPPIGHELRFDGHMRRVGLYDLDIN